MENVNVKGKEPIIETAAGPSSAQDLTAQHLTALYIGDLDGRVTEEDLKQLFNQIGDVCSVTVCTDQITNRALGYGYVNYINPQHAAKALEVLNFTLLHGRHIRLSYFNRDKTQRKSGLGNIFVKNLDKQIDNKAFLDLFSNFGTIISSKVVTDSSGVSKGYGFVHYDDVETARKAIEALNGAVVLGKALFVGPFMSKEEMEMSNDKTKFTNVYVKNLSQCTTEELLKATFGEFGAVASAVVMRDDTGKSKCFGFVNFEKEEDAIKSVEALNGRTFGGKKWYVGKAQKKSERELELKAHHQQLAKEAFEKRVGLNRIYIKNLDEKIDGEKLKDLFSSFGTITSFKVMFDPKGISKGFGFVSFSTAQEASKAILEMNGKVIDNQPLYVAIAENKEVRNQKFQARFSPMRPIAMVHPVSPRVPIYARPGLGQPIFYPHPSGSGLIQPPFRPRGFGPLLPRMVFPMVHQQQAILWRNPFCAPSQDRRMHPREALTPSLANTSPSEQ